ncbi:MAG: histidine--tRNA ligase [Lachnospirales bacterium]
MSKTETIHTPKGCVDIYGEDVVIWQHIEAIIAQTCERFCVNEIRTPIFEYTEVFKRDKADSSDMVTKEMYTFYDKGSRSLTLKPEGTAPVVRFFNENNVSQKGLPCKLYYITDCFRYENPASGRQRQFHQFGVEYFGVDSVSGEAEIIALATILFQRLGINNYKVHINSLGDKECRSAYNEVLKEFLVANEHKLCNACIERMNKNPLRTLDCKNESCQDILQHAPKTLDTLGDSCKAEFEMLLEKLDNIGIEYVIDKTLVRGLDYYNKTVFEFIADDSLAGGTICAGGRYDYLVEELGGVPTKSVGFGLGLERLVILYKLLEESITTVKPTLYIGSIGVKGQSLAEKISLDMRLNGLKVECNINNRIVKAQMKYADKIDSEFSLIIGDDEVEKKILPIRNMETGEVFEVVYDDEYLDNMINAFY